jgi:uracil-DNA glycosylase
VDSSWKQALAGEFKKDYFPKLVAFVETERRNHTVYPPEGQVFTALKVTPLDSAKVVILGQDPYHGPGQAHGLAFSVKPGVPVPPSLLNIYRELHDDMGIPPASHGNLSRWAARGVLLLNTTLTVRANSPGSHQGQGWEAFTDAVIRILSRRTMPLVFILWGRYARQKGVLIDHGRHKVFESAHPSPLSAANGFFGSKPFSSTNLALATTGMGPINWEP